MPLLEKISATKAVQSKAGEPLRSTQATRSLSPEEGTQGKMDSYRRRVKEVQEKKIRDAEEAAAKKAKAVEASQLPARPRSKEPLSPGEAQRQKDERKRQKEMEYERKVQEAEQAAKKVAEGKGVLTPEQAQLLREQSRARAAKMAPSSVTEEKEPLLPFAVRALGFFIIEKEGEKHDKAQEWDIKHKKERSYLPHLVGISTLNEGLEEEDHSEPSAKDIATENDMEAQAPENSKAQEALVPVPQIPDNCIFDLFKRVIVGDFPWWDLNQVVQASRGWSRRALSRHELRAWNNIYTNIIKARKDQGRLDDLKGHPDGLLFMRIALNDLLTWAMAIDQRWSVVKVDPIFRALNLEALSLFVAHGPDVYEIVLDMRKTRFENYKEKPDAESSEEELNDKPESSTQKVVQGAKDADSKAKAAVVEKDN